MHTARPCSAAIFFPLNPKCCCCCCLCLGPGKLVSAWRAPNAHIYRRILVAPKLNLSVSDNDDDDETDDDDDDDDARSLRARRHLFVPLCNRSSFTHAHCELQVSSSSSSSWIFFLKPFMCVLVRVCVASRRTGGTHLERANKWTASWQWIKWSRARFGRRRHQTTRKGGGALLFNLRFYGPDPLSGWTASLLDAFGRMPRCWRRRTGLEPCNISKK